MKLTHLASAAAVAALLGGAAYAQDKTMPKAPTPGSVTGDWNGAHAPSDEKQYQEKVTVPIGSPASATAEAPPEPARAEPATTTETTVSTDVTAPAASDTAQTASVTTTTVTNGPVPDTAENRAKYGQPMSNAGKRTAAKGN